MFKTFRFRLYPTRAQQGLLERTVETCRRGYNACLVERKTAWEERLESVGKVAQLRRVKELKATNRYAANVHSHILQVVVADVDKAYAAFFRRVALKKQALLQGKVGFPRPKTKKHGLGSFRLTGTIRISERHIQLPRLGKLRLKERGYLPVEEEDYIRADEYIRVGDYSRGTPEVKVLSATVSEKAGRWFVAVQVEQTLPDPELSDKPVVGVDLGLVALATFSDGTVIDNPRPRKTALWQVKRLQRRVSWRKPGGANRKKARERLARAHARVANIRRETLHQATTWLTKTKSVIVVEDLNVSGMQKNHTLALAIADVGWAKFKRQLKYKAAWRGGQVLLADRFYPSSKLCHVCGYKLEELALDVSGVRGRP